MLKIWLYDRKERKELTLVDPNNGVDWVQDFIGNTGSFTTDGDEPEQGMILAISNWTDEEKEEVGYPVDVDYVMSGDDFDWWNNIVNAQDEISELESELIDSSNREEYEDSINHNDLEDEINSALDYLRALKETE